MLGARLAAPRAGEFLVQECGAGLVEVRRTRIGLAFAAPPLVRSGPVEDELVERIARMLRIDPGAIVDSQWVDNGPGWVAVLLPGAEAVLGVRPGPVELDIGVAGPYPPGSPLASRCAASCRTTAARSRTP